MSNILRIAFKHERRIESRPLYQYDYGQILKFIDLELPYSYEVHFSNHEKGSSITQLGNENGVTIPDSLLTSGLPVYAWLYLHTGDADGETEYMVKIPVYKRAAITNDQPTPVQQDVITQTIAALASGVATATNSAAMAIASASEATAACDSARVYMNIAQASADITIASAQQAVTAAGHYPIIEEDNWYLWSVADSSYVDTGVNARGSKGDPFTYDDFTPEQLEALTGSQGVTFTPTVSPEGVIYWENDGGKENPQAVNIMGFSPVIAVSSITGGHQVSITDASGTQSFDVMDGAGSVQSVNNKTGAVVLTAEDVDAIAVPTAASSGQLLGYDGSNWDAVTIDFNSLPSGGSTGQVLKKKSNTNYDTEWANESGGDFIITLSYNGSVYSADKTYAEILAAHNNGKTLLAKYLSEDNVFHFILDQKLTTGEFRFVSNHAVVQNAGYLYPKNQIINEEVLFYSDGTITKTQNTVSGIPPGGSTGYVLKKSSNTNFRTEWAADYAVPNGGSAGQVLTKNNGGYGWASNYQVPTGGSNGQFLKKTGSGSADYAWASVPNDLPSGGTAGQVLKKNSATNYDVSWANESGGSSGGLFVATFSDDPLNVGEIVCDKTAAEISAAFNEGTPIIGYYNGIILYCEIENLDGVFRGHQYIGGTVRYIEIYFSSDGCYMHSYYKLLKYVGYFQPSQNIFSLETSASDSDELFEFFTAGADCECVACVTIDSIIREFTCAQRGSQHDSTLGVNVFFARFTCSEVVKNNGVYELHVFSFDSKQYRRDPSTIAVQNYAEKKVVLSAV